jgi:hypothetical protein
MTMPEAIPPTALQRAIAWLRNVLASGPLPVEEVERLAREAHISRRTLRRARGKLHVRTSPSGFQGSRIPSLPEGAHSVGPNPDHQETSDGQEGTVRQQVPPLPRTAGADSGG